MAIPVTPKTSKQINSIRLEKLIKPLFDRVNENFIIAIFIAIVLMIYSIALTPDLFSGGDNAHYIVLADALQLGKGFKTISILAEPFATERPPGFPLLLAPIITLMEINIVALKQFLVIWSGIAILSVYLFFKQTKNSAYAFGIAFLFALMPLTFMYARRVYAAMPFTAITYLALIFTTTYARKKHWLNGHLFLLSIFIIFGFYLRTIGVILFISIVLWLSIKKDYAKTISLSIICTPFIAYWFYWTSQVQQTIRSGYLEQLFQSGTIFKQLQLGASNFIGNMLLVTENIFYLSSKLPLQLAPSNPNLLIISYITLIFVLLFIAIGFIRTKMISLEKIFIILYMLVLVVWPHVIDRFIIPILPLMVHYYIQGITFVCRWLVKHHKISEKIAFVLFVGLILEMILSGLIHIPARIYQEKQFSDTSDMAAFYDVSKWTKDNLSEDSMIFTDNNNFYYIYSSRRKSIPIKLDQESGILDSIFFIAPLSQTISPEASAHYCSSNSKFCLFEASK